MRARTPAFRSMIALMTIALACADCRDFTAITSPPELPAGAQPIDPPADYAGWWSAVEQCAGRLGNMSRVQFFTVPGRTSFMYKDGQYDGYWWSQVHWIVLAGDKVQNAMIVRHEMLHDLLSRGDHPPAFFQARCGAIVACNGSCRAGE
jgi:hypothetical protein